MRRARARNRRSKFSCTLVLVVLAALVLVFYYSSSADQKDHQLDPLSHRTPRIYAFSSEDESAPPGKVTKEDILVALPSDESHLPLVRASRSWRKGIRTVIAVNDTKLAEAFEREARLWNETWLSYPDDNPARGNYPGDTRAAIVPFLAHKAVGLKYKWLLYGDDDTQWFVEGALKLLQNFDHNMPYFITDNLWWSSVNGTIGYQPNLEAPRCLPCGFSAAGVEPLGDMQFNAPEGCPCTPQLLCMADTRQVFDEKCHIPLHLVPAFSTRTYSMHGGAGGIMSVGLLRAVTLEAMEACIERQGHSTASMEATCMEAGNAAWAHTDQDMIPSGDAFITICLWKLGFAHTDPGPWFNDPAMRLFDAAPGLSSADLTAQLQEAAQGRCVTSICQELFENMVSSHVHSRKVGSIQKAADTIAMLSHAYEAFTTARNLSDPSRRIALMRDTAAVEE